MVCYKQRYDDRNAAQTDLRKIINRMKRGKKPTRSYKCPLCGFWHLTSQSKNKGYA